MKMSILHSLIRRLNIAKQSNLSKPIYTHFNIIWDCDGFTGGYVCQHIKLYTLNVWFIVSLL